MHRLLFVQERATTMLTHTKRYKEPDMLHASPINASAATVASVESTWPLFYVWPLTSPTKRTRSLMTTQPHASHHYFNFNVLVRPTASTNTKGGSEHTLPPRNCARHNCPQGSLEMQDQLLRAVPRVCSVVLFWHLLLSHYLPQTGGFGAA